MTGFLKALFGAKEETSRDVETLQVDTVPAAEPIHVTDQTFEEIVLGSDLPVLVDFWAPWCGPCRMIAPIIEELAQVFDGRATVAKVNTDESTGYASEFGIMGIPTLLFIKNGEEADRIVGFANRRTIEAKLSALVS